VLLNVLRGAAASGLAGMAPRHGTLVRPLLDLRRADTRALCAACARSGNCTLDRTTINAETAELAERVLFSAGSACSALYVVYSSLEDSTM